MQTTTTLSAIAPLGRTDRPQPSPLSQMVAKLLNVPAPAVAPQAAAASAQPPTRTDGRDIRLGSRVDLRV